MERGSIRFLSERSERPYMEWHQGRSRYPTSDSSHWQCPRSRSPVSHRRPLPVEHRHGYGYQPASYGQSRMYYADHYDRRSRHASPPSKRPRFEQSDRESSRDRRRDRQSSLATIRQSSAVNRAPVRPSSPAAQVSRAPVRPSPAVAIVSRAPAASATPEPCVTFPELWGTHMTEAMERQLDGWREETRQVLSSDPQSARGHSVSGGSSRASSVRSSRDGSLSESAHPVEMRSGSKRSHDGQWSHDGERRESSCAGSWRGGYKRSWDDVQDECPSPAKMYINRDRYMTEVIFNKMRNSINDKLHMFMGPDFVSTRKDLKFPQHFNRDGVHPGKEEGRIAPAAASRQEDLQENTEESGEEVDFIAGL